VNRPTRRFILRTCPPQEDPLWRIRRVGAVREPPCLCLGTSISRLASYPRRGMRALAVAINQIIQARKLSQTAAARRLKVNQPKVSALANYQLDGFSVERLMNFLTALDRDVHIVIRRTARPRQAGRILVTAAQA